MSAGPATPTARPAGIVTRLLAAVLDLLAVLLLTGALFLGVAGASFVVSPLSFRWPAPPSALSVLVGALLAVGYLAAAWSTTGRTAGAAVLGLRVLSSSRGRLGRGRALLRAVVCVVFPLGLLWSAVSRDRRSLQDVLVRSVVVYDWRGRRPV